MARCKNPFPKGENTEAADAYGISGLARVFQAHRLGRPLLRLPAPRLYQRGAILSCFHATNAGSFHRFSGG